MNKNNSKIFWILLDKIQKKPYTRVKLRNNLLLSASRKDLHVAVKSNGRSSGS